MNLMQESDMPVTTQVANAVSDADAAFNGLNVAYNSLKGDQLRLLNVELVKAGLGKINL